MYMYTYTYKSLNSHVKQYGTGVSFWVTTAMMARQTRRSLNPNNLFKNLFFLAHTLANMTGSIALMHSSWNTLLTQGFKAQARV